MPPKKTAGRVQRKEVTRAPSKLKRRSAALGTAPNRREPLGASGSRDVIRFDGCHNTSKERYQPPPQLGRRLSKGQPGAQARVLPRAGREGWRVQRGGATPGQGTQTRPRTLHAAPCTRRPLCSSRQTGPSSSTRFKQPPGIGLCTENPQIRGRLSHPQESHP